MIRGKKLLQTARRWHRMAVASRRRISPSRQAQKAYAEECSSSSPCAVPGKGKLAVYSRDGSRFVIPLSYLDISIFVELLLMSEEEFGLPAEGPIVIPCDAPLLAQVISLLRRRSSPEAQRAIIAAISGNRGCSSRPIPGGIDLWQSTVNVNG